MNRVIETMREHRFERGSAPIDEVSRRIDLNSNGHQPEDGVVEDLVRATDEIPCDPGIFVSSSVNGLGKAAAAAVKPAA